MSPEVATVVHERAPALTRPSRPPRATAVSNRIPVLDGIRGVAILLVLLFHFSVYGGGLAVSGAAIDRAYYRLAGAGWMGVDLFFVLSGFLITGILYDAKGSAHYFRNFYARRVLRIFPLYYFALLIFTVVLPIALPEHRGLQMIERDAPWYWTYLSNVSIARDGWPQYGAIGHFWSLAVEEQFYLLWPLVVLRFGRRPLQALCVTCIVGALIVRTVASASGEVTAAFVLTPARLDALAIGAYVALAQRSPGGLAGLRGRARSAALWLGGAIVGLSVWRRGFAAYDPVVSSVGLSVLAGFFGALLILALTARSNAVVARFLGARWLRFFGQYSYALYVVHHPILFFMPGLTWLSFVPTILGSVLLRQAAFLVIATGVSIVVALVSWHLIEKHFLELKGRFALRGVA